MPQPRNKGGAANAHGAAAARWRWRSPTLERAVGVGALGLVLLVAGRGGAQAWAQAFAHSAASAGAPDGAPLHELASSALWTGLSVAAAMAMVLAVGAGCVAALTRQLPGRRGTRRGAGQGPPARILAAPAARVGLATVAVLAMLWALARVSAGASRGVVASGTGLQALYRGWLLSWPWIVGAVLVAVAVFEMLAASQALSSARARSARAAGEGATR